MRKGKNMKTKMIIVGMMVVILLVFFTTPCFSQTINACYKKKGGALRIVADHSLCKRTELPMTWNGLGSASVWSLNDEYLGQLIDSHDTLTWYIPYLKKNFQIDAKGTGYNTIWPVGLYYAENNCQGTPYGRPPTDDHYSRFYHIWSAKWGPSEWKHFVPSLEEESLHYVSTRDTYDNYQCVTTDGNLSLTPLTEVTLPFSYPVALPLRLE